MAERGTWREQAVEAACSAVRAQDSWEGSIDSKPIVDAVLSVVVEALGYGYHPQNPTAMHPADYVTQRFQLPGHEN